MSDVTIFSGFLYLRTIQSVFSGKSKTEEGAPYFDEFSDIEFHFFCKIFEMKTCPSPSKKNCMSPPPLNPPFSNQIQ